MRVHPLGVQKIKRAKFEKKKGVFLVTYKF